MNCLDNTYQDLHIVIMREIVHVQVGQCGNQIGAKVIGALERSGIILRTPLKLVTRESA